MKIVYLFSIRSDPRAGPSVETFEEEEAANDEEAIQMGLQMSGCTGVWKEIVSIRPPAEWD